MSTDKCPSSGKIAYITRERAFSVAQLMASRIPAKKRKRSTDVTIYRCKYCQHFHIGHNWQTLSKVEGA